MKRFASFASSAGGSGKKRDSRKAAATAVEVSPASRPLSQVDIDANTINELEMLRAENAHLKRLIEQEEKHSPEGVESSNIAAAEVTALRNEVNELQRQLANATAENEALQRELVNLQRDRRLEAQELQNKARTLEAQIEFLSTQHQQELQEKDQRIRELEMKVVDLEQEVEIAQSPASLMQARSMDLEETRERAADLEKRLQLAKADGQRRADEAERLKEELEDLKARGCDDGVVAALNAERDYLRVHLDESEAKASSYQAKADELEEQLETLTKENFKKQELVNRLEGELAELRYREASGFQKKEEDANKDHAGGAPAAASATATIAAAEVERLQKLLHEKEKAVWDLSERLLQLSTERDQLKESHRQQAKQIQQQVAAEGGSTPQAPTPTGSSKKDKRPRSEVLEDNQQLLQQVQQLQQELQQLQEETLNSRRTAQRRIADLERGTVDAEKKTAAQLQELFNENRSLEGALRKKDVEIAALQISKEYRVKALEVARSVVLPMKPFPKRAESEREGSSEDDSSTAASSSEDLQVELALKTAALRSLSVKNAHLNDVLQRMRLESTAEYAEQQLQTSQGELRESQKRVSELELEVRAAKKLEAELQARITRLKAELECARNDAENMREALKTAQTRNATTADHYKQQCEEYSALLAQALSDSERLQNDLARCRLEHTETVQHFREEIRELRGLQLSNLDVKSSPFPLQLSAAASAHLSPHHEAAAAASKRVSGSEISNGTEAASPAKEARSDKAVSSSFSGAKSRNTSERETSRKRQSRLVPSLAKNEICLKGNGSSCTRSTLSTHTAQPKGDSSEYSSWEVASSYYESALPASGYPCKPLLASSVSYSYPLPPLPTAATAERGSPVGFFAPVEINIIEEEQLMQTSAWVSGSGKSDPAAAGQVWYPAAAALLQPTSTTVWRGSNGSSSRQPARVADAQKITPGIQQAAAQYLREYVEAQQRQQQQQQKRTSGEKDGTHAVSGERYTTAEEVASEARSSSSCSRSSSRAAQLRQLPSISSVSKLFPSTSPCKAVATAQVGRIKEDQKQRETSSGGPHYEQLDAHSGSSAAAAVNLPTFAASPTARESSQLAQLSTVTFGYPPRELESTGHTAAAPTEDSLPLEVAGSVSTTTLDKENLLNSTCLHEKGSENPSAEASPASPQTFSAAARDQQRLLSADSRSSVSAGATAAEKRLRRSSLAPPAKAATAKAKGKESRGSVDAVLRGRTLERENWRSERAQQPSSRYAALASAAATRTKKVEHAGGETPTVSSDSILQLPTSERRPTIEKDELNLT